MKQLSTLFVLCLVTSFSLFAAPIRTLPNLVSVSFFERTTSLGTYTFGANSTELTTQRSGILNSSNRDFTGTPVEFYDVFYSDVNGNLDINGEYISIEARFNQSTGSALNIAEIQLNFSDNTTIFGCQLGSAVGLGQTYNVGSEANAFDGDLNTHSSMGNTFGSTQLMRVTIGGFPCGQNPMVPTLSQWGLILLALGVLSMGAVFIFRKRTVLSQHS